MIEPRLHHYVPRFYLSGFADPGILKRDNKETIWVYERGQEPRPSLPLKEARQRDFYSYVEDGARNSEVEARLGDLEAKVAPIISSLDREKRPVAETEKEYLALFMGVMQMRTPAARWLSKNRVNPLVSALMKEAAADSRKFKIFVEENRPSMDLEGFNIEDIRKEILNGLADELANRPRSEIQSMIEVGEMVGRLLMNMSWLVIHSDSDQLFLTSDDPFVSYRLDERANKIYYRTGVGTEGAVVFFPLTRSVCLRLSVNSLSETGSLPGFGIRGINKAIMTCADRFVYAAERSQRIKGVFDNKGGRVSVQTADLRFEGRKY